MRRAPSPLLSYFSFLAVLCLCLHAGGALQGRSLLGLYDAPFPARRCGGYTELDKKLRRLGDRPEDYSWGGMLLAG